MKYIINKYIRLAIIIILVICIAGISFLTFKTIFNEDMVESSNQLYTYKSIGDIDYNVILKPNNIYEGQILGESQVYIMEYVDSMEIGFNYEFIGEDQADISGYYTISAFLEANIGTSDDITELWGKEFPLIANKTFTSDDGHIIVKDKIIVDLQTYNDFGQAIAKETKIDSNNILSVVMDINLHGSTAFGNFDENILPSIVFPINTAIFEVGGNSDFETPGAIEELVLVKEVVNVNQLIFLSIILGILLVGLVILLRFTQGQLQIDPLEKELRLIFRKYGDRIVALNTDIDILNTRQVRTIKDLITMADELGKPIIYKYSENYKDISKFYVINEEEAYVLDIGESMTKDQLGFEYEV